MKESSLNTSSDSDESDDTLYPYEDCPELVDEDELCWRNDEPDNISTQDMDTHFALLAYGYSPREVQQEIFDNFKELRGCLVDKYNSTEEELDLLDDLGSRKRRRRKHQ